MAVCHQHQERRILNFYRCAYIATLFIFYYAKSPALYEHRAFLMIKKTKYFASQPSHHITLLR